MNKKSISIIIAFALLVIFTIPVLAAKPVDKGFDEWGYNYGAHLFNGKYCDAYRNAAWCQAWAEDNLSMKWNEAWLSTTHERHVGFPSYIGSGAWLTNHMSGKYMGEDGKLHNWTYFVKIVAMPTTGYDCGLSGGYAIWGEFCVVQEVNNDPYAGFHGVQFKPVSPGLGNLN